MARREILSCDVCGSEENVATIKLQDGWDRDPVDGRRSPNVLPGEVCFVCLAKAVSRLSETSSKEIGVLLGLIQQK